MPVLSIGTDIVSVARIERAMQRHVGFLERILTAFEKTTVEHSNERIAGRFAAKEAVAKALGTGIGKVSWHDIEIHSSNGVPEVKLFRYARERADAMGVQSIFLSISHEREYAVATVIMEGKPCTY